MTKLVGSDDSDKYHQPWCRHIYKIKEENRIHFADKEDAVAQGYAACRVCMPYGG